MATSPMQAFRAVEWSVAAMALRSILARSDEEHAPGLVVELRVSVSREDMPGLAVIEYELIDHDGMAVAGGAL